MGVAVVIGNYTILFENPSDNTVPHLLHRNPVVSLAHTVCCVVTKPSFLLLTNDSFMNHPIKKSNLFYYS